jgi:Mn2+/Fe2+ NRAMP family transporter
LLIRLFGDGLVRAATVIFILIIALVVFNFQSDLPDKHPLFGVFDYLMVPVLFIAGGVVFVLAIWRYSR